MAKIPAKIAPTIINADPNFMDSAPEVGGGADVAVELALVEAAEADFDADVDAEDAVPDLEALADDAVLAADAVLDPEAVVETLELIVNYREHSTDHDKYPRREVQVGGTMISSKGRGKYPGPLMAIA